MRPVLAVSGHTTIPVAPGTDLDSNHKAVLMPATMQKTACRPPMPLRKAEQKQLFKHLAFAWRSLRVRIGRLRETV